MAKFGLDLSKFKKIGGDKTHTVMRHEDGHEIKLQHAAIDPKVRGQLAQLPVQKLAEGGDVQDSQVEADPQAPKSDAQDSANAAAAPAQAPVVVNVNSGGAPQPVAPQMAPIPQQGWADTANIPPSQGGVFKRIPAGQPMPQPAAPEQQQDSQAAAAPPQDAGQSDPFGVQATQNAYVSGLGEQKAGLNKEAAAATIMGVAQAAALKADVAKQQEQQATFANNLKSYNDEHAAFMEDYKNQHIDPSHYLNSMGTAKRISTGIGIILGGMGAGLTGGPNTALQFLNQQIDRDIDSQKAEMGKRENLMNANFKHFGNLRDAADMTRVMQMGIVSDQLKQAAAQAQGPMAKANALKAAGALDMQAAPILGQMAMLQGMAQGKVDPDRAITAIVPQAEQAAARKEYEAAQHHAAEVSTVMGSFDRALADNTVGNRIAHLGATPASVASLKAAVMPYLKDAEGRISDAEMERLDALVPSAGDGETKSVEKRRGLIQFLSEKTPHTSILNTYGIKTPMPNYNAQGQPQSKIKTGAPVR